MNKHSIEYQYNRFVWLHTMGLLETWRIIEYVYDD